MRAVSKNEFLPPKREIFPLSKTAKILSKSGRERGTHYRNQSDLLSPSDKKRKGRE